MNSSQLRVPSAVAAMTAIGPFLRSSASMRDKHRTRRDREQPSAPCSGHAAVVRDQDRLAVYRTSYPWAIIVPWFDLRAALARTAPPLERPSRPPDRAHGHLA